MTVKLFSSLVKVFKDNSPAIEEIDSISLLKNERTSFQVAVYSDIDCDISLSVTGFPGIVSAFKVCDVPVKIACNDNADDYYLRKEPGLYPDVLYPVNKSEPVKSGKWHSFWIELSADNSEANYFNLVITVSDGERSYLRISY